MIVTTYITNRGDHIMKKLISILLISMCILGFTACGKNETNVVEENNGAEKANVAEEDNISKFESEVLDFSKVSYQVAESDKDTKLEEAIAKAVQDIYGMEIDSDMKYYYNKIDLNGDEAPETFVYVVGSILSGTGGDTAFIFAGQEDDYKLVSDIALVQNPVIVSTDKTNGWNDLIMRVAGGGIEPFYAQLKFDGEKYPQNPSDQPEVEEDTVIEGTAIIADDRAKNSGLHLQ